MVLMCFFSLIVPFTFSIQFINQYFLLKVESFMLSKILELGLQLVGTLESYFTMFFIDAILNC
jgi:hypothetical protein